MRAQTIWKWTIGITDRDTVLQMPDGSRLLAVQSQGDDVCLWAVVYPDAELTLRRFRVHGTGHPIQLGGLDYIGTVQQCNGRFVWHVFEVLS